MLKLRLEDRQLFPHQVRCVDLRNIEGLQVVLIGVTHTIRHSCKSTVHVTGHQQSL